MMNAVFWRLPQGDRHVQSPDRQIPFHTIADRLSNDAAGVQIKDDGQI